ncbi:MAG TPA: hypothetical protein VGK53_14845 [Propionicimonas sp.]
MLGDGGDPQLVPTGSTEVAAHQVAHADLAPPAGAYELLARREHSALDDAHDHCVTSSQEQVCPAVDEVRIRVCRTDRRDFAHIARSPVVAGEERKAWLPATPACAIKPSVSIPAPFEWHRQCLSKAIAVSFDDVEKTPAT